MRNVKRGVEPHGELREELKKLLSKHLVTARRGIDEIWGEVARKSRQHEGEHAAVVAAAKNADRTMPKGRAMGPESPEAQLEVLEDLARDVHGDDEAARQAYLERIRDLPHVIESVDWAGNTFLDIKHLPGKVIIRLNTRHRFYREMWEPLKAISDSDASAVTGAEAVQAARRSIEALTLLLIAYGKAESMDENPGERYGDLTSYWGQFLSTLMTKVKGVI